VIQKERSWSFKDEKMDIEPLLVEPRSKGD